MSNKIDLNKIMEEIKKEKGMAVPKSQNLSQKEIMEMMAQEKKKEK